MEYLKENDILRLRPTFKFGGIEMIDWFEITEVSGFYSIRSGLKHADGETKSPYYYDHYMGGKNVKEKVINDFNEWWNDKNK